MSEIPKSYTPKDIEAKWQGQWLDNDAFKAVVDHDKEPFCIMIPPPNVTGMLHMGHVLNNTLQDIFIRRARMDGKSALWWPGTDHAGIATQTKVERILREEEGKTKYDLGRDEFLKKVWDFREENGGVILNQLKKLGTSCDWSRTSFTLDKGYAKSVMKSFVSLYERGYIYRGKRMVNWCPKSQTALSNEEVIMKEQQGFFYKMRYELVEPITDTDGSTRTHVYISTTRPETIMGDSAVAVNPKDERYQHLIGKMVYRPFPKAPIPIIADEAVELDFGTGCLKVTPAHDQTDFEIGQRHNLEVIDIMNPDGTLNELAGEDFCGMERFAARKKAAEKLEALGLLIEKENYTNNVGFSERADVPIEPRLSEQWFLRYPKIEQAKDVVRRGLIEFHPKRWEKTYLHWLDNIQDWCISRQLWWGHRIPVWYRKGIERSELDYSNPEHIHVSVDGPSDPENWEQDEDVLDTWASSNLWPFANFGWPDFTEKQREEFDYWFPTNVLVTGFDIIFFWVARMIMSALELVGENKDELTLKELAKRIPFKNVYINNLIRDEKGRKMSKSLGNSPDPLDIIDTYGADGLRFGIMNIAPKGSDILFSEQRIEIGRNFCNKIWNACRFRQMGGATDSNGSLKAITDRIQPEQMDLYDHWILAQLANTTKTIADGFANMELHVLTHALYSFFWGDFCDWYVEASKSKLRNEELKGTCLAIQDLVIRQFLQLAHPVMPHMTEELWELLGYKVEGTSFIHDVPALTVEELYTALSDAGVMIDTTASTQADNIKEFITKTRALKAEYNLGTRRDVTFFYHADEAGKAALEASAETIMRLLGAEALTYVDEAPEGAPACVAGLGTAYLDLASTIDVEAEKVRLNKELATLEKAIASAQGKLANEKFTANAPEKVIQGVKDQLAQNLDKVAEFKSLLKSFEA
jgi:valyl-tRNA synthetase